MQEEEGHHTSPLSVGLVVLLPAILDFGGAKEKDTILRTRGRARVFRFIALLIGAVYSERLQ